uniref:KilA-N domain-containing protein n=1 Tax=viral metagenome TaxID=1070528 RepID=A0A6C0D9Y7_9ZZZZ
MDNKVEFQCEICNKNYSSYKSLWNHNNKFHNINVKNVKEDVKNVKENVKENLRSLTCEYCKKVFNNRPAKSIHKKKCNKIENNKIQILEEQNKQFAQTINELKAQVAMILKDDEQNKLKELNKLIKQFENQLINTPINNNLIDIISNKNKKIEELMNNQELDKLKTNQQSISQQSLILNNIVITSRSIDNYINATQLCQAGGKKFNHWYSLDNTKQLINELSNDTGINDLDYKLNKVTDTEITVSGAHSLIQINKGGNNKNNQETWIHPDLAIQLAQWLSPKFAIQVSKWIRHLFTNGTVEINLQLVNDNKVKEKEIELLKNTYIKQQKRKNFPQKNVIYMLTTEDNKKKRIYIIGKAINLKQRLSSYNKTSEHEVVYYKNCNSEKEMTAIETLILNKLKPYQEKANRDRFILPIENDILLFTNIIDNCIQFFE